jgi:hypothetical protein
MPGVADSLTHADVSLTKTPWGAILFVTETNRNFLEIF